jgi:probable HAF family extracellular repeat protein
LSCSKAARAGFSTRAAFLLDRSEDGDGCAELNDLRAAQQTGCWARGYSLNECFAFQLHGFLLSQGQFTAIDFPGAAFTMVLGISDDGEIVGQFTDPKGDTHGFKAVPIGN